MGASRPAKEPPLDQAIENSNALRTWLGQGLVNASGVLTRQFQADVALHVVDARSHSLADFGTLGLHDEDDDLVAGVLRACHGPLAGVGLFSMDPQAALDWSRCVPDATDPIATFVDVGGTVLADALEAVAAVLSRPTELHDSTLVEDTLAGCLLSTHAPPDTVMVGSRLMIETGERDFEACVHLLLDAKLVDAMLGALTS